MKLKDARENYYFYSGKVSDISRQLALTGLALIWFFKTEINREYFIPGKLKWPAILILLTLISDFLQYAVASVFWGTFQRRKEKELKRLNALDSEFRAPDVMNRPAIVFYGVKMLLLVVAYGLLLSFLYSSVRVSN